jgi:hypothetical protein
MKTCDCLASSTASSRPSGVPMSSVIERLPRFVDAK